MQYIREHALWLYKEKGSQRKSVFKAVISDLFLGSYAHKNSTTLQGLVIEGILQNNTLLQRLKLPVWEHSWE